MVFYCQRNCYEKEYDTKVTSCKKASISMLKNGKKTSVNCYEVIFEDTVFFPEGGGQPDDQGKANEGNVLRVLRKGGSAIHYVDKEFSEGDSVHQEIDWERRFDHMQQHSGQHLITAIAEQLCSMPTVSWYMGEKISYIEMKAPKIDKEQMKLIEDTVNRKIREATPVIINEYDINDSKLEQVRSRGLPDDVVGPVRVVSIENVDVNMCCGTHVRNLSDLQAIKLLQTEKGKAGNTLLYFVCGGRVLNYLSECFDREKNLNVLLHSCPEDHYRLIEKTQKDLKGCLSKLKNAHQDLAVSEANNYLNSNPRHPFMIHHRNDADIEYLGAIVKAIDDSSVLKVLSAGEGNGILLLEGPNEVIKEISPKLCEILEGKGGGKTRFTAKVNNLKNLPKVKEFIYNYYKIEE